MLLCASWADLTCCHLYAVSSAEDPEKLLDRVVDEMQEDLIKMRQASAQVGCAERPAACMQAALFACVLCMATPESTLQSVSWTKGVDWMKHRLVGRECRSSRSVGTVQRAAEANEYHSMQG